MASQSVAIQRATRDAVTLLTIRSSPIGHYSRVPRAPPFIAERDPMDTMPGPCAVICTSRAARCAQCAVTQRISIVREERCEDLRLDLEYV